jgi:hypothetical protein
MAGKKWGILQASVDFIERIEDVLETYTLPSMRPAASGGLF